MRKWVLLVAGVLLLLWGAFLLGFLEEPSVVDNLRVLLIVLGAGSIALGLLAGGAGVWMLLARRT
jgi:hypothetical protein